MYAIRSYYVKSKEAAEDSQKPMLKLTVPANSPSAIARIREHEKCFVYPNPIKNSDFTIQLNHAFKNTFVCICNLQGQTIYSKNTNANQITIPNRVFPTKGVFLLTVDYGEYKELHKISKL